MKRWKQIVSIMVAVFVLAGLMAVPVLAKETTRKPEKYRVVYYPNNGNDKIPSYQAGFYVNSFNPTFVAKNGGIEIITIQETGYTKKGYQFVEWNTKPDGSGDGFLPGTLVWNMGDAKHDCNFYAQWIKINPMKIAPESGTLKKADLKKAAKSFKIKVVNAKGKVTFKLDKNAKAAKIKVTAKGKVTVPQNTKKGTYKIGVIAAGTKKYAAAKKIVTIVVK